MFIDLESENSYNVFISINEFLNFIKENNITLCIKDITINKDDNTHSYNYNDVIIYIECYDDINFTISL